MTMHDTSIPLDDGVVLHAAVHEGGGPAVVFLHDLDCSGGYWSAVVERLLQVDPDLRLILLDLRGHGASGTGDETSRKRLVKDLKRACKALGLEAPVLCGHGWGADIALASDIADSVIAINPLLGRFPAPFDTEVARPAGLAGAVTPEALAACTIGATAAKRLRRSRRDAPLLLIAADPLDCEAEAYDEIADAAVEAFRWQGASRHLPIEAPLGIAALISSWMEEMA